MPGSCLMELVMTCCQRVCQSGMPETRGVEGSPYCKGPQGRQDLSAFGPESGLDPRSVYSTQITRKAEYPLGMVRDMLNSTEWRIPPTNKSLQAREVRPMAMKVSCPNCLSLLQVPR